MYLKTLSFNERATYSAANTFPFLFTVIGVNMFADLSATNIGLLAGLAIVAGIWLGGLALLTFDLVDGGDRRIRPLALLATLGYLLALCAWPGPALAGGATLALICWLPYMIAESAGQTVRVWAYFDDSRHAGLISQIVQAVVDAISFGGTGLLIAATYAGPVGTRTWATLAVITPVVVLRALRRHLQTNAVDIAPLARRRIYRCPHATLGYRGRHIKAD